MNQYLITAYDHTDEGAFDRRMGVRPHHLDGAKELKAKGNYVLGGAMLNEFENEEELEAWQQSEPYITQKIWESVDIKPFKVANV
jgi:uncharacterized protein YciI